MTDELGYVLEWRTIVKSIGNIVKSDDSFLYYCSHDPIDGAASGGHRIGIQFYHARWNGSCRDIPNGES
jgi:hypothetical protein